MLNVDEMLNTNLYIMRLHDCEGQTVKKILIVKKLRSLGKGGVMFA